MIDGARASRGRLTETPFDGVGLWSTYWPFFQTRRLTVLVVAASSFGAGMAEALLLVVLANIALAVGGQQASSLNAAMGPFGAITTSLGTSFLIAVVLLATRGLLSLWSASAAARLTAGLTTEIRTGTFADFFSASWAEQSLRSEADVQDLLQRHVTRATSAVNQVTQATGTACTMIALLGSAFLVDPVAAVLMITSGILLFLAIRPVSKWAKTLSKDQILLGREYAQRSLEAISSSFEIRSFGVAQTVEEQLNDVSLAEMRPYRRSLFLRQVVLTSYQTATVALLLMGLFGINTFTDRPLASLGAIVLLLVRSLNQAASLQGTYHSLIETAPYIHRLTYERQMLRDSIPPSGDRELRNPPWLRFEGVSYSYDHHRPALSNISFTISQGEAIGIIGPSGGGKSTLIQVLLRLRHPDSGSYDIGGLAASEIDDASWFTQIAFVPQESRVIAGTVADNIAFFRDDVQRDQIILAAQRAHLHDEIMEMPEGYDTLLGSRGGALSGGQRQRLCIARALLKSPTILVLDEPTSALDLRSEALIHETLSNLKGSVTMFAIAHRLSTLNTCDKIIVMDRGKLAAFGSRDQLERENLFYQRALELSRVRQDGAHELDFSEPPNPTGGHQ